MRRHGQVKEHGDPPRGQRGERDEVAQARPALLRALLYLAGRGEAALDRPFLVMQRPRGGETLQFKRAHELIGPPHRQPLGLQRHEEPFGRGRAAHAAPGPAREAAPGARRGQRGGRTRPRAGKLLSQRRRAGGGDQRIMPAVNERRQGQGGRRLRLVTGAAPEETAVAASHLPGLERLEAAPLDQPRHRRLAAHPLEQRGDREQSQIAAGRRRGAGRPREARAAQPEAAHGAPGIFIVVSQCLGHGTTPADRGIIRIR